MDVSTISQIVSSVGFPIAMCGMMAWYLNKIQDQHKEEMDKMSEAINNNTVVMEKILTKLGEDSYEY